MSTDINIKKKLAILEESVTITNDASSINFTGNGVTSSNIDGNVTVSVPGGSGTTTYYFNETVTQTPYKEFSSIPTTAVEQVIPFTIAGGTTTVIAEYQTPSGVPGTTQIPAGLWQLFLHFNATSAGQEWIIRPTVYKRDLGGIETLLFTPDPEIVIGMSTTTNMYTSDGVFPATTLLTTDRIVVKIAMQNTTGVSQTANFRTEGSQHYSVALTTLNQVVPTNAVTSVTGTAPIASSGGTTPAISISQSSALSDGYLSSSDWSTFNAKVPGTRNITINGVTQDLSADRTWTIATSIPQTNIIYVDSVNGVNAATGRGDINTPYLTPEYALSNITNTGTVTATTTSGSATLTAVSDTTNIQVGQYITGTGIPYDSIVVSKTSNTIVLSRNCTASATITATWWTIYEVMLIGNFTVTSNLYKHGFVINAETYTASINFGAFTLFNVLTQPLIPINVVLYKTVGTSASSKLFDTNGLSLNGGDMYFYYGNYYSIGTAVQIGNAGNKPAFSGDVSFKGVKFDARFGSILHCSFTGNFSWQGENSYGLLGGISLFGTYSSNKFYFNDNLTTPASVIAISNGGYYDSNIYGNINGSTSLSRCYKYNIYANLNGTTHSLGDDGASTHVFTNYYGNITGTINAGGYLNFYGILTGNINTVGTLTSLALNGIVSGTITCSGGNVFYESKSNANGSIAVVIGAGRFTHNGSASFTTISYTGAGTFTNNGTINCGVGANNPPSFTLSSGGKFINNGTIKCTSQCAAIFDKSASSTFINNGIMTNPLGMYIRYLTNSSPSRDLIIGNSICDGNLYARPSAGCGAVNVFTVVAANTNTSVDIFDGTSTVTISVVGAGKSISTICQEIVTLIQASSLRYQGVATFSTDRVLFVNVTGTTPTFTNLVNISSVSTFNGGGGFTANVLAAGTELASSFYSNF